MSITSFVLAASLATKCPEDGVAVELNKHDLINRIQLSACLALQSSYEDMSTFLLAPKNIDFEEMEKINRADFQLGEMRYGRLPVDIEYRLKAGAPQKVTIWLGVSAHVSTLVFKSNLPPITKIEKSDVEMRHIDLAALNIDRSKLSNHAAGYFTSKSVRKGQVVTEEFIRDEPMISANKEVLLVISNGNVSVATPAKSIVTAWAVNDEVTLEVEGMSGVVIGIVTGRNRAHVKL